MPELPEVETIVRGLRPWLEGRRIKRVECLCPRMARGDLARIEGRRIQNFRRHGKFILADCEGVFLAIHLGMTGKLLLEGDPGRYTRVVFTLEGGVLLFDDVRTLGRVEVAARLPARIARLGPEPLAIGPEEFIERLGGRRGRVKPLLLNQTFLRGIGNIYADEALFRAGIHPRTAAARLSRARARRLHAAIREVLEEAIAAGGSSISDYVDATGKLGEFQFQHRVYGREEEACPRCGAAIRRIVLAQRSAHFCPRCQR
ncbi:MAG: bifunctional DNA-formamidopyrimidine glycosylase/DNA-(apurinic or apyrimidinic site) lyase [Bryobacteraceae bacterium]